MEGMWNEEVGGMWTVDEEGMWTWTLEGKLIEKVEGMWNKEVGEGGGCGLWMRRVSKLRRWRWWRLRGVSLSSLRKAR